MGGANSSGVTGAAACLWVYVVVEEYIVRLTCSARTELESRVPEALGSVAPCQFPRERRRLIFSRIEGLFLLRVWKLQGLGWRAC